MANEEILQPYGNRAMAVDSNGKVMEKVASEIEESKAMLGVDIQARLSQTIQTHSGTVVANGANSDFANFIDCDGFDKLAGTFSTSISSSMSYYILWSNDGITAHGYELANTVNGFWGQFETGTKARYAKVRLTNNHTAPVTMSAWAYLKA